MNLKTRINIKGYIYLTIFIILFSYFESPYLNTIGIISNIYNISKVLSCMLFALLIINNKKFDVPNYIMIVIAYNIYLFTRSVYLGLPIFNVTNKVLTMITFFIFVDYLVKFYAKEFIDVLFCVLLIFISVNLILMIKYEEGIYNIGVYNRSYWLLGHVNNMPVFIFPAIIVSIIKFQLGNRAVKLLSIFLFFISLFSILYGKSATSIIGLFIILYYILNKYPKLNFKNFYTITLLFFIFVVVLGENFRLATYISNFFNRSITFTGRTYIWEATIFFIKKNLLFGNGIETDIMKISKIGFTSPHNRYLNILYTGGLIGFLSFNIFLFFTHKKSYCTSAKFKKSIIFRVINYTCCSILVVSQMEAYSSIATYLPFIFLANSDCINKMYISEKEEGVLYES